ncbi:MAG TPA: dihydrofolate reductase family protein [Longimicrobiales bacterium]
MRKVIVNEFLTLDGVMQGPGHVEEDRSGGFDQGGWQPGYFDEVFGAAVMGTLASTGGLLLGRRTYDTFAAHWPSQPAGDPLADVMNGVPKFVVSMTLDEPLAWQNSTLVNGDLAREITKLKKAPGNHIDVIGSGDLVQSLLRLDLVDEFRLMIHPLVLGSGGRLFREGIGPLRLRLTDAKPTTTGVLIVTYEKAGADVGAKDRKAVAAAAV